MSREPDGFWTDEDRGVAEIDPLNDELVLDDDDDDDDDDDGNDDGNDDDGQVDLDDWGSDADERTVDLAGDGEEIDGDDLETRSFSEPWVWCLELSAQALHLFGRCRFSWYRRLGSSSPQRQRPGERPVGAEPRGAASG
jgi:hypothetical protein